MSKTKQLSPSMEKAIALAKQNQGKLHRHPGGYWSARLFYKSRGDENYGTKTIQALVSRGIMQYSVFKETFKSRFPIEAELTNNG